jgi:hypothetical protein
MRDQREKDAIRLLNQQIPIWRFLREKEFWQKVLNSPTIYLSFMIVVFAVALLVPRIIGMGVEGETILTPQLFSLVAILIGTAFVAASSAFNLLRTQQLKKHLEIIRRAQENKD